MKRSEIIRKWMRAPVDWKASPPTLEAKAEAAVKELVKKEPKK